MNTKKSHNFGIAILVVVLGLVGIYFYNSSNKSITNNVNTDKGDQMGKVFVEDGEMMKGDSMKDDQMKAGNGAMMSGSYEVYSPEKLSKANTGKVVLFFNAGWCPSCQSVAKELTSTRIVDGLVILSVDYDASTDLKKKYKVTYQHTFVQVDADGKLIKKWSGGDLSNIVNMTK